jgi:high affinity sulfate transporter 1
MKLPIATWLPAYKKAWLRVDVLAGVSVAAVAIPIAIAYAKLAGVPPVYGLYSSLLPLVIYAILGSSRQLVIAPDAATCAIVFAVVAPLAGQDPARSLTLTAALSILAGVLCVVAGFARLGFLTNFLARPILTGYLNGIALCIITGQLGTLFGFSLAPAGFFRLLWEFLSRLGETHLPTLLLGLAMLALQLVLARVAPKLPGPLAAVLLGIAASVAFGFADHGIRILGAIPAGLPYPRLPGPRPGDWQPLLAGAAGLALISYNSAMVTAKGFAAKNHYDIDSNQEFLALGAANVGSGLLGGFAVSGADSRTAMNDSMGGKSQVVGLVAAIVIGLTLVFFTGPLGWLPVVVLSAVLIKAAFGLFDWSSLFELRRVSPPEFWLCVVTLLGVITVGVLPGVVVAVVLAMLMVLTRASHPHDAVLGRVPGTQQFGDLTTHPGAQPLPGLVMYRFDGPLLFFNSDHFRERVRAVVTAAPKPVRHVLVDAETMPYVDVTGAAVLDQVRADLESAGLALALVGAKSPVRGMLGRTGLLARLGPGRVFPTLEAAVAALSGDAP